MTTKRCAPLLCALLALVAASACQELPTQQGSAVQPTTIRTRSDAKAPVRSTASAPDFTGSYPNLVPGSVVRVNAYRVDATRWRVEITVLTCCGDMCTATWLEAIYTSIAPTHPAFESVLRSALDIDSDGVWNWEEKIKIDYQE